MSSFLLKHYIQILPGLYLLFMLLLHVSGVMTFSVLDRLELWIYDQRLNLLSDWARDDQVVIVDIDEKSLAEEGRWPWHRNRLARLVEILFDDYQAAVVGFDVLFAEKDDSAGLDVFEEIGRRQFMNEPRFIKTLQTLRDNLDYDRLFADAIRNRPVVFGYYLTDYRNQQQRLTTGSLPPPAIPAAALKDSQSEIVKMTGYGANLSLLQNSAASAGHFNSLTDLDGVCRRVPMLLEYDGNYYESFSLAVVRTLLWSPPLVAGFPGRDNQSGDYRQMEWLEIADLKIPVDSQAAALVPYRGRQGSFSYISAVDVLQRRVQPEKLNGAVILVGTTSPGLMDLRSTPVGAVYPGVEVHANMIAGILDQSIPHRPAWTRGGEFFFLLVCGLSLCFLLPTLGPWTSIVISLGLLAGIWEAGVITWQANLVMPLAASLVMVLAFYLWNVSCGFLVATLGKRKITSLFGYYVPPQLVAEMSKNPKAFSTEGENRVMTVLFSDIRDFTRISEELDPKELASLMNIYMSEMTEVIQKHRGTIDKYIGDAIMAFWGAPLEDPDHAGNAVLAALEMQKVMTDLRPRFAARGWPELHVGIGVNTGPMNVGNMGSKFRMAYTVLGDAVNLGARLEGITKQYGVDILVGETTCHAISGIAVREIDHVLVKGKNQPVPIFEPLGVESEVPQEVLHEAGLFTRVLAHYRNQEWDRADTELGNLLSMTGGSKLYRQYRERIAHFRSTPPPGDWNGVYRFHEK